MFNAFHQYRKFSGIIMLVFSCLIFFAEPVQAACPAADGSVVGSQVAIFQDCTETKVGGGTSITLASPAGTAVGDLLVAIISTDGNPTITPPGTWTTINQGPAAGNAARLGVFYRVASLTGAQNHAFTLSASEHIVGSILRFTNHDGIGAISTAATGTGSPTAPSVTPVRNNSLVIRVAGFDDDDGPIDPATIITGHRNITQDDSGNGAQTTSMAAAYINQVTGGIASGTALFLSAGGGEQWRSISFVVRPTLPAVAFRITHSGSGSTCAPTTVTFTAVNQNGGTVNYTGPLTITAPNGNWASIGD
ncbi:MAG: hypothetical protein ACI934_001834, partial [Pseudohongiellaceae bacterium]